jgi:hypothetical protein
LSAEEREKIEEYVKDIGEPSIRDAIRSLFEKDVQSRKRVDAGKGMKK